MNAEKKQNEKISEEKSENKIVNLCEDMNFHEHDEKSYERMKKIQDSVDSSNK